MKRLRLLILITILVGNSVLGTFTSISAVNELKPLITIAVGETYELTNTADSDTIIEVGNKEKCYYSYVQYRVDGIIESSSYGIGKPNLRTKITLNKGERYCITALDSVTGKGDPVTVASYTGSVSLKKLAQPPFQSKTIEVGETYELMNTTDSNTIIEICNIDTESYYSYVQYKADGSEEFSSSYNIVSQYPSVRRTLNKGERYCITVLDSDTRRGAPLIVATLTGEVDLIKSTQATHESKIVEIGETYELKNTTSSDTIIDIREIGTKGYYSYVQYKADGSVESYSSYSNTGSKESVNLNKGERYCITVLYSDTGKGAAVKVASHTGSVVFKKLIQAPIQSKILADGATYELTNKSGSDAMFEMKYNTKIFYSYVHYKADGSIQSSSALSFDFSGGMTKTLKKGERYCITIRNSTEPGEKHTISVATIIDEVALKKLTQSTHKYTILPVGKAYELRNTTSLDMKIEMIGVSGEDAYSYVQYKANGSVKSSSGGYLNTFVYRNAIQTITLGKSERIIIKNIGLSSLSGAIEIATLNGDFLKNKKK